MFSKFVCVAAFVGVAAAQQYSYEKAEESEIWTFTEDAALSAANLDLLEARVAAIEENQGMVVSGVQLAQSSMDRVDSIVNEVSMIQKQMSESMSKLETTHKTLPTFDDVRAMDYTIEKELGDAVAKDKRAGKVAKEGIIVAVNALHDQAVALDNAVSGRIQAMMDQIDDTVTEVKEKGAFYGSIDHIKQVTGYHAIDDIEKYWDGKTVTSAAEHQKVRGRKFYRVKFNAVTPGYFTSGSDELFFICMGLDKYLRSLDGISRDLRPPCNHYNHARVGGLNQCIFIWNSYFSYCGGTGFYSQNIACAGVPEEYLRMSVQYETTSHNWDRHLVHHNAAMNHRWQDPYKPSAYIYSFCTSGNMNYLV